MTFPRRRQLFAYVHLSICCLLIRVGTSAVAATEAFPPAAPESIGLTSEALDQLAAVVDSYLDEGQIVGAELLVIKNRHTVLHRTFGWRDRESETAMTRGTIFNIRSMTKPLTGAAAQMLMDSGQLGLDDRVSHHIPGFDNAEAKDITVRQLLTHRSGLPFTILSSVDQYPDLQTMANAVGQHEPQFPPNAKFWYSDAGSDVLGAIVAQVSQ